MTAEKNSALVRNAEISQQMEMAKQESRRLEAETNELSSRISQLEDQIQVHREKESKNPKQELKSRIASLEEQLEDKNKVPTHFLPVANTLIFNHPIF